MAEQQGNSRFRFPWRPAAPARSVRRDAEPRPDEWRSTVRSRLLVCAAAFALWTTAIEARLVYLQVVDHAELTARAERQQMRTVTPPAKRGEIFDRHGRVLAYSVDADTIAAVPTEIDHPQATANALCSALDECSADDRQSILRSLTRRSQFAYIARQVSPEAARRVRDLSLPGIVFLKESRRYYPKKDLAAQVLGYVGVDNVGLAGIESVYDAQIRGRDGKVLIQADARRQRLFSLVERPATAGAGIELTIDQYLQYIAERELRAGVLDNRAAAGTAVILDPSTGEILAMASYPTFNPNAFGRADDRQRRNRAIQDLYEPGSTFKVITASAALEEHAFNPDTLIDTEQGTITFGARVIHDTHRYGTIPFTDVIVKSSNVGAIKVGMRLGADRLGRYISRFGFGQVLGPDFRGESPGIVWDPAQLNASALASVSMGYQIGVTPLQMVSAVASVANGGELFEPRVVRAFIRDGRRIEVPHKVLRRTISPRTAATLTAILEQVVDRGTAETAQIPGYTVAGKTGTAAKLVDGHYSKSEYNASFVGFVPSRNPALAILVVIDSPHAAGYYGGTVSAPVFRRIAEAALTYLGVPPNIDPMPPVLVARDDAPPAPEMAARPASVVAAPPVPAPAREGVMPDLRGMSAREALRTLAQIGITPRLTGSGFVVEQQPEAGEALMPGHDCVVRLGRRVTPAGSAPQ
ncbi:MAG TPA: penicillin-binding protein [Vicinamibacterales bacterium]|nr:penicillin-binding protein [Vicinamibacterales bacterium]